MKTASPVIKTPLFRKLTVQTSFVPVMMLGVLASIFVLILPIVSLGISCLGLILLNIAFRNDRTNAQKETQTYRARYEIIRTLVRMLDEDLVNFDILDKLTYEEYQAMGEEGASVSIVDIVSRERFAEIKSSSSLSELMSGLGILRHISKQSSGASKSERERLHPNRGKSSEKVDQKVNDIFKHIFDKQEPKKDEPESEQEAKRGRGRPKKT